MKKTILIITSILTASNVYAAGFEDTRLNTSFMYDEGHSVTLQMVRKSFDVKGDTLATNRSVLADRTTSSLSAKYQLNEDLSFGLTAYNSGAINLNYQGAGSNPAGTVINNSGPKVSLSTNSVALLANYLINDSLSLMAGARYDRYKVAQADIYRGAAAFGSPSTAGFSIPSVRSDTDVVPIIGAAFSKPEIAMRVELLYQGKAEAVMPTTCSTLFIGGTGCTSYNTTAGLPELVTLKFQTAIAKDTLLLGSIHKGKWSASQISVPDNNLLPTTGFKDSLEYSLGLGRRITDKLSVTASYNWDQGWGENTDRVLRFNNGYQGVSLGARYSVENLEFTLGYSYTKLGDLKFARAALTNDYLNNTAEALLGRVKVKF